MSPPLVSDQPAVDPDAALSRATAMHRQGRLHEAAALYRAAIAAGDVGFEALHGLGVAALQLGQPEEAARLMRRALRRQPDAAGAHNMLGLALTAQGHHAAAAERFERAIALRPDLAGAHSNRGLALAALDRHDEAAGCYRRALALAPGHALSHHHLGRALLALGRPAEALAPLAQALALDPRLAGAHLGLGDALRALDRPDEALAQYRQALALAPGLAEAHANLGTLHEEQGRLAAAREEFAQAIEAAPRWPRYYHYLADHHRFTAADPYLAALEGLAAEAARDPAAVPPNEQPPLHFALAKAYADLGDPARSFRHLADGNALQRRRVGYDEAATLALFDRIRAVFTDELIRAKAGQGDPSSRPVFIIGMPRSGTTLIEQILASHPQVHGAGELDAFAAAVAQGPAPFPEAVAALDGPALRRLGAAYVAGFDTVAPDKRRVTDKLPANFRFAGLIHLALPNARLIHVRRDPVDTCVSCFARLFTAAQPHTCDLAELGRYYRAYDRLMAHWRRVLPPGVMLELRYEAVVAGLETQARQIIGHCGLDWDDAVLSFHRTERPVRTASAAQVRQPIYRTAIGRSQPYRQWLGPLVAALGDSMPGVEAAGE